VNFMEQCLAEYILSAAALAPAAATLRAACASQSMKPSSMEDTECAHRLRRGSVDYKALLHHAAAIKASD
jgi:hypothetical protein